MKYFVLFLKFCLVVAAVALSFYLFLVATYEKANIYIIFTNRINCNYD
jgi:hypothetical protein